ncbi:MAG TPA: porin [Pasteurellaceae bacterium]|nr:porin [Pasteurellaceae bacterium]
MKKTLLALAVTAFAASSANATVIYKKDGTTIDLDGRAHFELMNEKNPTLQSTKRTDLKDRGTRLRVRAYQEIGGGFSALGGVELRFSDNETIGSNFRTHRLFAGITNPDIGTLTFGRQLVLGDHIPKANYTYEWGGNVLFDAHKKSAAFMSKSMNGVRLATDYYFGNSNKHSGNNTLSSGSSVWDEGQGFGVGAFYDGSFGDFTVRFGSGYTEVKQLPAGSLSESDEYKLKRAGVGFDVKYQKVTLGFDWAYGKATKDAIAQNNVFQLGLGGGFNKINRYQVGLKFDVTEQNALYSAYYFGKGENPNIADQKMRGWMIGADHRFNKSVAVYIEGGKADVKQAGTKVKDYHRVLVGTRILF